jgi:2-alkyl-3-oxoalkanoate reductase
VRIAVTGASGFCGSMVAWFAAAAGHRVLSLGRRPGTVGEHRRWDAARERPDLHGADVVIHLAAAVGDPARGAEAYYRAVNVDGTRRLFEAAGERPVVWVSSASVYSPGPYERPLTEEHPTGGQHSVYGRTKAEGERIALAAGAVVLRPRAVYGDDDPHLLPRLARSVLAGRAWLPGPDVPMSLTAVENLAEACLAAIAWEPGAYNVTDERPYRRDEIVARAVGVPVRGFPVPLARGIAKVSPRLSRYVVDQLTDGMVLDISKALRSGYRPRRTLDDYLVRTTPER